MNPCETLLQSFSPAQKKRRIARASRTFALVGNPNCGKTTLFNALTGLRAQTANHPGTTVEKRVGYWVADHETFELIDLPGLYDFQANTPDERVALEVIEGDRNAHGRVDGVLVVVDATHLSRSLFLASQLIERKLPVVIALTMTDVAEENGLRVDAKQLELELGCPVIRVLARNNVGVSELIESLRHIKEPAPSPRTIGPCGTCGGCRFQSRYAWTDSVASRCSHAPSASRKTPTEFLDRVLTHPVLGMTVLMAVMVGLFYLIFKIAAVPMDWIDAMFAGVGAWLNARLPESEWRDLLVQGILGGVGGVLVFLPQICILFFCLTLLEDTGYLARAAFAMDRFMHKAGLPGQAFVPLLSAHACAIPALMATRVIADNRDRLVTILITPLMSCSARIPVYSMLAALLFPREPAKAALVFTGAYALGLGIALAMAFAFKKTLLQGEAAPLLMELPALKWPSLRTALLTVTDRALLFARKAGGVILLVSILLWTLSTYPKCEPPLEAHALQQQAEAAMAHGDLAGAEELEARANRITSHHALAQSAAGRLGKIIEPGLRPLGFDWQIGIGILSSFAAREVIVSTLSVIYGMGEEVENLSALSDSLRQATRPDGHPVFTPATSASLLVFFVIAMQCLPTLAVTRRETNSWKWPLFQLFYLSALAYLASFVVYNGLWLL